MNHRRTALDCDGVLADWTSYLLQKLDVGLTVEDCYDFSLRRILKELRGRDVARRADAICSQPSFTASQPVLPWAHELVELSMAAGDILITTAPWASKGWYDARVGWLKANFNLHQDQVMVGRAKPWVKADLFVDDKPKNIVEWALDNSAGRAVLLAWPYNLEHPELPSNARRLEPDELLRQLREGFPPWAP